MAAVTGVKGAVVIPGTHGIPTALVTRWTMSVEREVFDISNFDNATNERTKLGGMVHIVGTLEGIVDSTTTPPLTDLIKEDSLGIAALQLEIDAGATKNYSFSAIITSLAFDIPKAGVATFVASFESTNDGALILVDQA